MSEEVTIDEGGDAPSAPGCISSEEFHPPAEADNQINGLGALENESCSTAMEVNDIDSEKIRDEDSMEPCDDVNDAYDIDDDDNDKEDDNDADNNADSDDIYGDLDTDIPTQNVDDDQVVSDQDRTLVGGGNSDVGDDMGNEPMNDKLHDDSDNDDEGMVGDEETGTDLDQSYDRRDQSHDRSRSRSRSRTHSDSDTEVEEQPGHDDDEHSDEAMVSQNDTTLDSGADTAEGAPREKSVTPASMEDGELMEDGEIEDDDDGTNVAVPEEGKTEASQEQRPGSRSASPGPDDSLDEDQLAAMSKRARKRYRKRKREEREKAEVENETENKDKEQKKKHKRRHRHQSGSPEDKKRKKSPDYGCDEDRNYEYDQYLNDDELPPGADDDDQGYDEYDEFYDDYSDESEDYADDLGAEAPDGSLASLFSDYMDKDGNIRLDMPTDLPYDQDRRRAKRERLRILGRGRGRGIPADILALAQHRGMAVPRRRGGGIKGSRPRRDEDPICKVFKETGDCKLGIECPFSHDCLRTDQKRQEVCKFYLMDTCAKGDRCTYLHSELPCKYWHTGYICHAGENCKYSHEKLTEDGKALLKKVLREKPLGVNPGPKREGWVSDEEVETKPAKDQHRRSHRDHESKDYSHRDKDHKDRSKDKHKDKHKDKDRDRDHKSKDKFKDKSKDKEREKDRSDRSKDKEEKRKDADSESEKDRRASQDSSSQDVKELKDSNDSKDGEYEEESQVSKESQSKERESKERESKDRETKGRESKERESKDRESKESRDHEKSDRKDRKDREKDKKDRDKDRDKDRGKDRDRRDRDRHRDKDKDKDRSDRKRDRDRDRDRDREERHDEKKAKRDGLLGLAPDDPKVPSLMDIRVFPDASPPRRGVGRDRRGGRDREWRGRERGRGRGRGRIFDVPFDGPPPFDMPPFDMPPFDGPHFDGPMPPYDMGRPPYDLPHMGPLGPPPPPGQWPPDLPPPGGQGNMPIPFDLPGVPPGSMPPDMISMLASKIASVIRGDPSANQQPHDDNPYSHDRVAAQVAERLADLKQAAMEHQQPHSSGEGFRSGDQPWSDHWSEPGMDGSDYPPSDHPPLSDQGELSDGSHPPGQSDPHSIPDNLPPVQRQLMMRLQQNQKAPDSQRRTDDEENWYSSDEDDSSKYKQGAPPQQQQNTPPPFNQGGGGPPSGPPNIVDILKSISKPGEGGSGNPMDRVLSLLRGAQTNKPQQQLPPGPQGGMTGFGAEPPPNQHQSGPAPFGGGGGPPPPSTRDPRQRQQQRSNSFNQNQPQPFGFNNSNSGGFGFNSNPDRQFTNQDTPMSPPASGNLPALRPLTVRQDWFVVEGMTRTPIKWNLIPCTVEAGHKPSVPSHVNPTEGRDDPRFSRYKTSAPIRSNNSVNNIGAPPRIPPTTPPVLVPPMPAALMPSMAPRARMPNVLDPPFNQGFAPRPPMRMDRPDPRGRQDPRAQRKDPRGARNWSPKDTTPEETDLPKSVTDPFNPQHEESTLSTDGEEDKMSHRTDPRFKRRKLSNSADLDRDHLVQRKRTMEYNSPLSGGAKEQSGTDSYSAYNRPRAPPRGQGTKPVKGTLSPPQEDRSITPPLPLLEQGALDPLDPNMMLGPETQQSGSLKDVFNQIDPAASPFC